MADMTDLLEVGRHHGDCEFRLERALDEPVDFRFRADIDSSRRVFGDEQPPSRREPAADDDLLLIAARETLDRQFRRIRAKADRGAERRRLASFGAPAQKGQEPTAGGAGIEVGGLRHGEGGGKGFLRSIACEQTDARAHGRAWRGQVRRLAVDQDGSVMRDRAEEGAADFFLARAPQADKADELALANVEVDRARARRLEAAHDDPRRPWSALALVEELERGTAHNEAYELVGIGLAHGLLADEASVAHHHDPVGDAKNLVEAMRDIDNADAPG